MTGHANPSHWSGATRAPVVKRRPCRFRCGASVDVFKNPETGQVVQLDTEPAPVSRRLTNLDRGTVYEYRGPRIGWVSKWDPANRTWRELRLAHRC